MKFIKNEPRRRFRTGVNHDIEITDCGRVRLEPDELVSFETASGRLHDFAAKSWGFYATPSVNGRLAGQGFKTALVKNAEGRYYIMVVEPEKMVDFEDYLRKENNRVVEWLDERRD